MRGAMLSLWSSEGHRALPGSGQLVPEALSGSLTAGGFAHEIRGAREGPLKSRIYAPHPVLLPDGEKGPWAALTPRPTCI
jgi:hypothetical protein